MREERMACITWISFHVSYHFIFFRWVIHFGRDGGKVERKIEVGHEPRRTIDDLDEGNSDILGVLHACKFVRGAGSFPPFLPVM